MQAKYRGRSTSQARRTIQDAPQERAYGLRLDQQHGTSAIEFALVFPLFFLIFYAILTYGLIMVAQQSVTLAAAEGARAALRHVEGSPNIAAERREENARQAAVGQDSVASWLGSDHLVFTPNPTSCPYNPNVACYEVTVSYPYESRPLIPLLLGPLMNVVIPEQLSSTAIVQLN